VADDGHGGAWVGLMHGGLQHLTGGAFETPEPLRKAFSNVNVLALHVDRRGRLWMGTLANGVSILDGTRVIHLGEAEGLADARVYAIEDPAAGRSRSGTGDGL